MSTNDWTKIDYIHDIDNFDDDNENMYAGMTEEQRKKAKAEKKKARKAEKKRLEQLQQQQQAAPTQQDQQNQLTQDTENQKNDEAEKKRLEAEEAEKKQTLITMLRSNLNIYDFLSQNNIQKTDILEFVTNSNLHIEEKVNILQRCQMFQENEQNSVNSALIKHEYELVNNRVTQFVNNRCTELALQVQFKQFQLNRQSDNDIIAEKKIKTLNERIIELEKQLLHEKDKFSLELLLNRKNYEDKISICQQEMSDMKAKYLNNLKEQNDKYQTEITKLSQSITIYTQYTHQINELNDELQQKQQEPEQIEDLNYSLVSSLQQECLQLTNEKQFYEKQYIMIQQQLNYTSQRNVEIQKLLTEEKKFRLSQSSQNQEKQSEVTKQLQQYTTEQAYIINQLQEENTTLQNTLIELKQQIEKLNISSYEKRIELQSLQLKDKDEQIETLTLVLKQINEKQLKNMQLDEIIEFIKTVQTVQQVKTVQKQ
ncbi:Hypothetical_protein [Hexamita inflata]|uniref:Hypothetical_protein n=1 Tax=Hexamita inflata TaxID=28002 RepID=A0AA86QGL5_9EUKA|nr:Hypothetical protein HINF_LOCUS45508 [Hexamita inflata]